MTTDDISHEDSISQTTDTECNEIQEVQKMSQADTNKVRLWRFLMMGIILATAAFVTFTTYRFLKGAERDNFETAFKQFSRTVSDAATNEQRNIRYAMASYANSFTSYAMYNNKTWPYVTLPLYEKRAEDLRIQANSELSIIFPIVKHEEREKWVKYATSNYKVWFEEGHMIENGNLDGLIQDSVYHQFLGRFTPEGIGPDIDRDYYTPFWQSSPPPFVYSAVNWNLASIPDYNNIVKAVLELKNETCVSRVRKYTIGKSAMTEEEHEAMHSKLPESQTEHPHTFLFRSVHRTLNDDESDIVAIIGTAVAWDAALLDLLPDGVEGIYCVIKNDCNQSYTYEIIGGDAILLGEGDEHEPEYDSMQVSVELTMHTHPNFTTTPGHCQHTMHIYPSHRFKKSYDDNIPEIFALVVASTFVVVAAVFFVFDLFVERRNNKLMHNAARSNAIVSSMFPTMFHDRLMLQRKENANTKGRHGGLKAFLNEGHVRKDGNPHFDENPLAELFLNTTVLFADIVGFTAWSSVREPSHVFKLLETVFSSFDKVAKRCRVCKIETVGDCYVAVSGLPEPCDNHALLICRFAHYILIKMNAVTKELEVTLGPDTGDLSLRVGIHSGPVTAGVLRGERSRFQLFGDTMNTAARMESLSQPGRIHLSSETASLVIADGKTDWIQKRADKISVKGKGVMDSYWFIFTDNRGDVASLTSGISGPDLVDLNTKCMATIGVKVPGLDERSCRLIDWNVEKLLCILKEIVARRNAKAPRTTRKNVEDIVVRGETPLEEVQEIISLPEFDKKAAKKQKDINEVHIPLEVVEQLQHYVSMIAKMYRNNPFHSFDHASHVVMSVTKLMSRIVAPSDVDFDGFLERESNESNIKRKIAAMLHDHTYGITSDPLTQFACAFSALIHDVDHTGVPNSQLIKENAGIAAFYKNRSVAEQNSLDLSWDLLMTDKYQALRASLFSDGVELKRFRQLVVNSVMATDIVDKDLKVLRNARWDKAFMIQTETQKVAVGNLLLNAEHGARDAVNRKATIVIEHLIQASDVSHTMQHWHIFRKWNERLFEEMYKAYQCGRAEKDPCEFWYKGEIGFFDYYIIPLAKKLKECGVFGISSDEYLNYAMKNRQEWEARGQQVVAEMIAKIVEKDLVTSQKE